MDMLLQFAIKQKKNITFIFYLVHLTICIMILLAWQVYGTSAFTTYQYISQTFGQVAVVFFVLTLLPGICRRLGIRHPLVQILMLFRRQLGLTMFFLVAYHGLVYRLFSIIIDGWSPTDIVPGYELFGIFTLLILLFPMAFTSNDWSVRHMGVWWKRLHMMSYLAAWTIFFHLILIEISFWSLLVGLTAFAEVYSWIYWSRSRTLPPTPTTGHSEKIDQV
jgi:DMSO/TMAO reductase YedYZ heme-binding membrane subunit